LFGANFFFASLRLGEKKIRVLISKKGIMRARLPSRKASGRQGLSADRQALRLRENKNNFTVRRGGQVSAGRSLRLRENK
jgi:hypothetical protein